VKRKAEEERGFLSLAPHCALKRLETPALYDIDGDELYELDEEAFAYLASCPPVQEAMGTPSARELTRYCLEEGLVECSDRPRPVVLPAAPACPTLRYLLVHITDRCNLRCRHCFLGDTAGRDLPTEQVLGLAGEFAFLQGLRFIVSGGEPLRHRGFWKINERLTDHPFRSILLTNGTLLDRRGAGALRFDEVQVSIDGLEDSHDLLRGPGSFRKALRALELIAETGRDLSVATMVHRANLPHLDGLRDLLGGFPLRSWAVDVPCLTGNLAAHRTLAAPPEEAAPMMALSFGGGYYGSSGPWACGPHLAAVMADGVVCKCGHYADRPVGRVEEGLAVVWERMPRFGLAGLSCRCSRLAECRGGCRYRAELSSCIDGPDPIQCLARGVPEGGDLFTGDTQEESREGGE